MKQNEIWYVLDFDILFSFLIILLDTDIAAMAKNTTLLLQKLRGFMKSSQYGGPIQAYIIPSCDAHQVSSC